MIERISVEQASQMIDSETTIVVDIRDESSFNSGHIDGAIRIDNDNVQAFLNDAEKSKPILVCCYHGNSSQATAEFFNQFGFARSYSMDGGMVEWAETKSIVTTN
jgi:thiosulfate sulfurtransferase